MENVEITDFGAKLCASELLDAKNAETIKSAALSLEEEDERAWALAQIAKKLAQIGKWEEAEDLAATITLPYEKANAFIDTAKQLLSSNEFTRALKNLADAEIAAEIGQASWFWQTAENFARIGQALEDANSHAEALRVWDKAIEVGRTGEEVPSHDREECSSVLWRIAEYLALAGELEKATSLASSIRTDRKRDQAVTTVARIAGGDRNAGHKWY